jgi:glycosyltransferase involved in cell wall biosynthesis
MPVNAAIFYNPDGYDTTRPALMGRHAAGEAFLKAYVQHGEVDPLYCYARSKAHYQDFERRIEETAFGRTTEWIPFTSLKDLAKPGCIYLPGPGLNDSAWHRRFVDQRAYSLCGVTHTTATQRVMDRLGDMLLAPVQSWDALICTSQVVKTSIEQVLGDYAQYLASRVGARPRLAVQLPVIPLGVDSAAFALPDNAGDMRQKFRERYKLADDDIVVLFMGRLNYHAKANPLGMYVALERAAARIGKRFVLVLSGWFGGDASKNAFFSGAKQLCPSVKLIHIDGRKPEARKFIWHVADIFTSLSDNVQETFGLTPLEGMAAGLPVVVSDWDGYRETVRPDIDGIMVPTAMPSAGQGRDLALRQYLEIDEYENYVGKAAMCTAVDVEGAAEAYATLANDAGLRRRMGEAGRKRAREEFDWAKIIPQYQTLWQELAERRAKDGELAPRRGNAPMYALRADPFRAFACYPSHILGPETRVELAPGAGAADFSRTKGLKIAQHGRDMFAPEQLCLRLIKAIEERGAMTMAQLAESAPPNERSRLQRTVGWLAKMGVLRLLP